MESVDWEFMALAGPPLACGMFLSVGVHYWRRVQLIMIVYDSMFVT